MALQFYRMLGLNISIKLFYILLSKEFAHRGLALIKPCRLEIVAPATVKGHSYYSIVKISCKLLHRCFKSYFSFFRSWIFVNINLENPGKVLEF